MSRGRIRELLTSICQVSIGVVGDFCLDGYWELDATAAELSIETGKPTFAVREQRYSLGGAGNTLDNVISLGARRTVAIGVRTDDLFGREMLLQLESLRVDTTGLILQSTGWDTPVYAKPYLGAEEQRRIDFGRSNSLAPETEKALIAALEASVARLDAVISNQQLPRSLFSPTFISCLNRLAEQYSDKFFVLDSRDRSLDFHRMIYKINASEAARLFGTDVRRNEEVPAEDLRQYAAELFRRFQKPVFITRSSLGILVFDGKEHTELPALKIDEPIDTVGAGDTAVAAIACSLAAGATLKEAGMLANLAAAVTIKKLKQTGTASPIEILNLMAKMS